MYVGPYFLKQSMLLEENCFSTLELFSEARS